MSLESSVGTMEAARSLGDEFVSLVSRLAEVESPTDHPDTIRDVHAVLAPELDRLGYDVRLVPGRTTGDHLLARPKKLGRRAPIQLLVGHTDTVWPLGTLERMPVEVVEGRLHGPGTFDMKGGLAMMIFALRLLQAAGREPSLEPVIFMNADEEVGSPDSKKWVRRLARASARALVIEPAMGSHGAIKTARKGVGRFDIEIVGKAAHAGLSPESGASAILELSHVVQSLHALNDADRGTTVNVGVVDGGSRPNVVAATARARVDVRVVTREEGIAVTEAITGLRPIVPGVELRVHGGMEVAPLERTERNAQLWDAARSAGRDLGLELTDVLVGGGSDGNTTSLYTATLDGLGCVGDGAHADHEHIVVDATLQRIALLAELLMAPPPAGS